MRDASDAVAELTMAPIPARRALVLWRDAGGFRTVYDAVLSRQLFGIANAAIISLFLCIAVVGGSIFLEQVYDRVLVHKRVETLVLLFLILVGILAVTAFLKTFRDAVLERAALQIDDTIRPALFAVRLRQGMQPRHEGREVLDDLDNLRGFVGAGGLSTLMDALPLPIYIAACFLMHWLVGATALLGSVILVGLALLQIRQKELEAKSVRVGRSGAALMVDTLMNVEAVHALGMRGLFRIRWLNLHRHELEAQSGIEDRAALLTGASQLVGNMLSGVCMAIAAYLAVTNQISPGNIIGAMLLTSKLLMPLMGLAGAWPSLMRARSGHWRLRKLFNTLAAEPSHSPLKDLVGSVIVDHLSVAAPGSPWPILKDVCFTVPAGATVAVVGPSGAGKSTLVRALTGIWHPTEGSVRIDGKDLSSWEPDTFGARLGYLPQSIALMNGSIAENIARFGSVDDAAVLEAAELAGVHGVIMSLYDGYNTDIGTAGSALSGGQRQRVALARAIYGNPSLVVMDEPNANLDAPGEAALAVTLSSLKARKVTSFVITHKSNLLVAADLILVLKNGAVAAFGERDEILPLLTGQRAVAAGLKTALAAP